MVNLELNIFKLKDYCEIEEVILRVKEEAEAKYEYRNFEKVLQNGGEQYNLKFFFYMNKNSEATIDWYKEISHLFEEEETMYKKVYSGYGILLVYCDEFKYALIFGRAMYLLNEYIDWDFGLEMASRMLDKNSINAQSSKFFSTSKDKSLVVYNKGRFNAEVGEAVDLINADITEAKGHGTINELNNYISTKVGFSSGLKIVVSMEEIRMKDILQVIILINRVLKKYTSRIAIPKLIYIKSNDPIILRLQQKLNQDILDDKNLNVSLNMYTMIDSKITLLDNICKYRLTYKRKSKDYDVLDIADIRMFIKEHNISDIENVNLRIYYDDTSRPQKILKIIDYTTELDGEDSFFCLYDGRWTRFNIEYVKKVDEEIKKINSEIVCFDNVYECSDTELEKIKNKDAEELLSLYSEEHLAVNDANLKKLYTEFIYNYKISKLHDGKLLDRKRYNEIEICDIYSNNQLIHTKIGSPGHFNECINQSLKGFEIWNFNKEEVKAKLGIDTVNAVTLLLITDNKSVLKSKDISRFKSLRFKLNLIEWTKQINEYNKEARIIIAEAKS